LVPEGVRYKAVEEQGGRGIGQVGFADDGIFFNGFAGSLAHCPHALLVGTDLLSPTVAPLSRTTSTARVVGHGESNTLTFPYTCGELFLHWESTWMEREVLVLVTEEPELL
jgi:hypothetical protein